MTNDRTLNKNPLINNFERQISDISFNCEKPKAKKEEPKIQIIQSPKKVKTENSAPLIMVVVISMFTLITSACLLIPAA